MPRASWLPCSLLVLQIACVTRGTPIDRDGAQPLDANEGILIVHVDSDVGFHILEFDRQESLHILEQRSFGAGMALRAIIVDAGVYRFNRLADWGITYAIDDAEEWHFRVQSGRTNYPGQIVIRRASGGGLYIFHRPRTAMALTEIRRRFPTLLEHHPPVYTGVGEDEFVRRYLRDLRGDDEATEP